MQKQWDMGVKNRPDPTEKHTYDEQKMMAEVIRKTSSPETDPNEFA